MENRYTSYTSLELSIKLAEAGCELGSEIYITNNAEYGVIKKFSLMDLDDDEFSNLLVCEDDQGIQKNYYSYDILNDICVKYAVEFFGEHYIKTGIHGETTWNEKAYKIRARYILELLQEGNKQEAETYIWENCKFNPKNKEE
jgi:hypothetical protein